MSETPSGRRTRQISRNRRADELTSAKQIPRGPDTIHRAKALQLALFTHESYEATTFFTAASDHEDELIASCDNDLKRSIAADLLAGIRASESYLRLESAYRQQLDLEMRGNGRARRYSLTASTYRAIAGPSAYVRVREYEPIQQEQMVTSFVSSHGRITRSQVAELCGLTSAEARAMLRKLTARNVLALRGERRGAHYVLGRAKADGHQK